MTDKRYNAVILGVAVSALMLAVGCSGPGGGLLAADGSDPGAASSTAAGAEDAAGSVAGDSGRADHPVGNEGPDFSAPAGGSEVSEVDLAGKCAIPRDAEELTDQLIRLINVERLNVGSVEYDPELAAIASDYACTMIEDSFFGHVNPKTHESVTDRLGAAHYDYRVVGENLAAGFWNPFEIIDAWMASESHREILLDPSFARVGVAIRYGGEFGVYCVLIVADSGG